MEEKLTECEERVMAVIWNSPEELDLMRILEKVNKQFEKDWKPQTVSTFLARIVDKRYLDSYRKGRVFLYVPRISREKYLTEKLLSMEKDFGVSKEYIQQLL